MTPVARIPEIYARRARAYFGDDGGHTLELHILYVLYHTFDQFAVEASCDYVYGIKTLVHKEVEHLVHSVVFEAHLHFVCLAGPEVGARLLLKDGCGHSHERRERTH